MALTRAAPNDIIASALYNEIVDLLNGTALAGQPVLLTQLSSASAWGLTVKNLGAGGQALRVQSAAGADKLTVSDTGTTLVDGTFSGAVYADLTLTEPALAGAWQFRTPGAVATDWGTSEGGRPALIRIIDTDRQNPYSCGILLDSIEDSDVTIPTTTSVVRTGFHAKRWSRLDRGDSSNFVGIQTGGGGNAVFYNSYRMRPAGLPNLSYSSQGPLEIATDNMSQSLLARSGFGWPETATWPWPTLTIDPGVGGVVLTLSSVADIPIPGGAVPRPNGGFTTWRTPMYVRIGYDPANPFTTPGEVISYTGVSGNTLTGCVRGVNSTAAAHAIGSKVETLCANNAVVVSLVHQISKGLLIEPYDGATFDSRPAITVGNQNRGGPADLTTTFNVTLAGALSATSISTSLVNTTNAGVTTTLSTLHLVGTGGTPTIAAGTGAGNGAGTTPVLSVVGTDLAGVITVTTGTQVPVANAIVATITFATAFAATPKAVTLTPYNAAAALLSGAAVVYDSGAETTTAHFVLRSQGTALAISTAYQYQYVVVG